MKKVLIAVTAMALMAGVTAISVNAAEEKDMKGYVTVSTSANTILFIMTTIAIEIIVI